ncbi:tetratricopeptide repeat protein 13 [Exaiptasia diaphana]|uniref:Uncharacterized protein n=1 Tax=Exaiptasia diaphana TaxID=2652724 RepID=A0A913Y9M5_EXADI|nr:tetratricopeptide repeat protein 13 [Exaiptasia diaphana]KXJ28211.1 Tetratricopeptide repeat protein 13 [Exaiptasia diaphana]
MAVVLCFLLCFLSIAHPSTKAQQFTYTHDFKYSCLKTSQILHINLGSRDSSQNVTPIQSCRPSKEHEDCPTGHKMCSSSPHFIQGNEDHFIIHSENAKGLRLVITHESTHTIFSTGVKDIDEKVASGMMLLNSADFDGAIKHFTSIIKDHPWVASAYFGRGTAHVRKGIQNKENADAAIRDFSSVIAYQPKSAEGWIRRAEVYSPLGRIQEALADITTALDLQPTSELYLMKGTLLFMSEDYVASTKMFEKSLDLKKQPAALLYLGLSMYHRGLVKEAIVWYKKALEVKPNLAEIHRNLGHAYRELGNADSAYKHFSSALLLEPDSAPTFQLIGVLLYMNGKTAKALENFKACLRLEPQNAACVYMEGLCYASLGNFYNAVRASTRIIVDDSPPDLSQGITVKAHYLKEYSRYLHSYLDTPMTDYSADLALDGRLRDHWVKSLPFSIQNYTEQPGIQPQIREVENVTFRDFSPQAQVLLCKSAILGPLVQYHTDGFLPNVRHQRAMGLAIIDVAQVARQFFKVSRKGQAKIKLTWRDLFDVAIKWRRVVDPDQPVLWLDLMPDKSVKAGFNVHMTLVKGQMTNIRYAEYFDKIFQFTKTMLLHFYKMDEFTTKDFKRKIEKSKTCEDLINVLKLQNPTNPQPGLMLSTHVASLKSGGKSNLDGIMLMLSEGSGGNLVFSMDTATTPSRTASYHSELEYIWTQIQLEARKPSNKENDPLGQYILSLAYYFFNLMPLSRGSSAVAYTVALGLFLAAGRETTGKIPKGKEVDLEAIIGGTADVFSKQVKGWLGLKKPSKPVSSWPSVQSTFPTLRTSLEALNVEFTDTDCRQAKNNHGNTAN